MHPTNKQWREIERDRDRAAIIYQTDGTRLLALAEGFTYSRTSCGGVCPVIGISSGWRRHRCVCILTGAQSSDIWGTLDLAGG